MIVINADRNRFGCPSPDFGVRRTAFIRSGDMMSVIRHLPPAESRRLVSKFSRTCGRRRPRHRLGVWLALLGSPLEPGLAHAEGNIVTS